MFNVLCMGILSSCLLYSDMGKIYLYHILGLMCIDAAILLVIGNTACCLSPASTSQYDKHGPALESERKFC